jgi:hypothetical protein
MDWLAWFSVLAGSGRLVASILGAWLTYAARWNGERTRELVRSTQADTQALLREMHNGTHALLREMQAETRALIDRLDQRADERHRDTLQLLETLRTR